MTRTRRHLARLLALLAATTLLICAAPAHADQMPSWPPPVDWMPNPGEEPYAHLWGGGWSGLSSDPYERFQQTNAALPHPSAADLVPSGTEVSPQGYCHGENGNGDDLEKTVVKPQTFIAVATDGPGMFRVSVSCIYGYEGGDPTRPYGVSKFYGVRVAPAVRPTKVYTSDEIEVTAGDAVSLTTRVLSAPDPDLPERVVDDGVVQAVEGDRVLDEHDLALGDEAVLELGELDPGRHDLVVRYRGGDYWEPSQQAVTIRVRHPAALVAVPDPVRVRPQQPVAFAVSVVSESDAENPIEGELEVQAPLGQAVTVPVHDGVAQVELPGSTTPPGEYELRYLGDDLTAPARGRVTTTPGAWLSDVAVEERRYGVEGWQRAAGADPVIVRDGNPTRVAFTLANPTSDDAELGYRLIGPDGESVPGSTGNLRLAAGAEQRLEVRLPTDGEAWWPSGAPRTSSRDYALAVRLPDAHTIAEQLPVRVDPLPVLLVHGWNSSAAGWDGAPAILRGTHPHLRAYAVGDGQFSGTMDTGDIANPGPTYTIAENAQQLGLYLDGVRQESGAFHVDLVAHSMGGLISRQYLQHVMPDDPVPGSGRPVVRHLVQMGTPNLGSPCANRLIEASLVMGDTGEGYRLPQPSTYQLTTDHAEWFDQHVTDLRGVPVSNLVGTGYPLPCGLPVDSDIVVPLWSSRWNLPAQDRPELPMLHTDMTTSEQALGQYVLPRLATLPGEGGAPVGTGRRASGATPDAGQDGEPAPTVDAAVLKVPSTGTGEVTFDVPAGTRFGVTGIGAGVQLELVSRTGAVADTAAAHGASAPFAGVAASHGEAGTWTVHGTVIDGGAARSVPLALWVEGSALELDGLHAVRDGERTHIAIDLRDAGQPVGGTVTALLTDGGGPSAVLTLHDDGLSGDGVAGDGRYGYLGALPDTTGPQSVVVRAEVPGEGRRVVSAPLVTGTVPDPTPVDPDPVDPDPVDPDPVDPDPVDPDPVDPDPVDPDPVDPTDPTDPTDPVDPVPAPVILTQPSSTTTAVGGTARFAVTVEGQTTGYRWQVRSPGEQEWRDLAQDGPDTDGPLLSVRPTSRAAHHASSYRVVVTGPGGTVTSDAATLRVDRAPTTVRARLLTGRAGSRIRIRVGAENTVPTGTVVLRTRGPRGRILATTTLSRGRAVLRLPIRTLPPRRALVVRYRGSADHQPGRSTPTPTR